MKAQKEDWEKIKYEIEENSGLIPARQNNICVLHSVVDSQFTDLKEPERFLITRLPEFKEPWIDPNEPVINYKKHEQTCVKNRKKRKKKRRR